MTTVTFLGVGGAMAADPADNHTALAVRHGPHLLLLDCGPTIMRQLERVGLTAGDPTHVVVSHQHGDHSLGLPMLLLNRVLFWPDRPLAVLAVPSVLTVLKQLTHLAYPDLGRRLTQTVSFVPLAEASVQPLPDAAEVTYELAPGKHSVPSWAVRLNFPGGRSLVYSADTGPAATVARLAAAADLLVHDTYYLETPEPWLENHSSAEQVAALAETAGVKALALVHRELTDEASAAAYVAAAQRQFSGRVFAPMAGDAFTF
ncbi:MAG: MBL fold metallo-hydrolase [Caldilineales bacterium]|nr:MBL fold metallo-hydrolase [Caldilineales bacterium]MDW8317969.1 MBL fold metallo-hydrolase [Anaerolineae bacterium]